MKSLKTVLLLSALAGFISAASAEPSAMAADAQTAAKNMMGQGMGGHAKAQDGQQMKAKHGQGKMDPNQALKERKAEFRQSEGQMMKPEADAGRPMNMQQKAKAAGAKKLEGQGMMNPAQGTMPAQGMMPATPPAK